MGERLEWVGSTLPPKKDLFTATYNIPAYFTPPPQNMPPLRGGIHYPPRKNPEPAIFIPPYIYIRVYIYIYIYI